MRFIFQIRKELGNSTSLTFGMNNQPKGWTLDVCKFYDVSYNTSVEREFDPGDRHSGHFKPRFVLFQRLYNLDQANASVLCVLYRSHLKSALGDEDAFGLAWNVV